MPNWLDQLTRAYSESEAPPRFFYWAGMSALSAAVRKNIWLDRFHYKLYANINVFIVADSGMKKGVPVKVCKDLLNEIEAVRVISGRNSIQQVLSDLAKPHIGGGETNKSAQGILISGELAAFLTKDSDSLTILTDIHDTHSYEKEWKYSLRSGVARLQQPCVALLGATNEEHFDEAVPASQIGGGFIARTFIVYSSVPGNWNSLTRKPVSKTVLKDFVPYLTEVSKLKGEMLWSEAGIEAYDTWYYPYVKGIVSDKTGTRRRLGDQVLKAAMLISLAESTHMVLEKRHIDLAIKESLLCAGSVDRVVQGTGKGMATQPITLILRELLRKEDHIIGRKWFLKRFWNEGMSAQDFDLAMTTFLGSGAINVTGVGEELRYILCSTVVDEYGKQEQRLKEN